MVCVLMYLTVFDPELERRSWKEVPSSVLACPSRTDSLRVVELLVGGN